MTVRLGPLVVDAVDPAALERFWATALGRPAQGAVLSFRPRPRPKAVKNRVHLDVVVRDIAPLLDLGRAQVLAEYSPASGRYPQPPRRTLADVEGNEFCAFLDPALDDGPPARAFAVCTDSDRPEELAAWWARLVGADVGNGPDGTPRWLHGSAGWQRLVWKFVRVDDERVVPNRWQWSVHADPAELLAAGAMPSPDGVLVDPQGNEFSAGYRAQPGG